MSTDWLEQSVIACETARHVASPVKASQHGSVISKARTHTAQPRADDDEQKRIEAVFAKIDSQSSGLVSRTDLLTRLRSERDLRLHLRLQANARDDELLAFQRVFKALAEDPHYRVDSLTCDEFAAYIRAHRHRATHIPSRAELEDVGTVSSNDYSEAEIAGVIEQTPAGGLLQPSKHSSRLLHAAALPQTKIIVYVRVDSHRSQRLPSQRGRIQQRRGFVMVDTSRGSLADVRLAIQRDCLPVPSPFLFVLDLSNGSQCVAIEDEMQVLIHLIHQLSTRRRPTRNALWHHCKLINWISRSWTESSFFFVTRIQRNLKETRI